MRRIALAASLVLVLSAAMPGPPPAAAAPRETPSAQVLVDLRAGKVDPARLSDSGPALAPGKKGLYLVQFKDVITDASWQALSSAGAEVGPYMGGYAFVVRLTPEQARGLGANGLVRAVTRYRHEWKAPQLAGKTEGTAELSVRAFPGAEKEAEAAVRALGIKQAQSYGSSVVAQVPLAAVKTLTQSEAVLFIEEAGLSVPLNDVAGGLIKVTGPKMVRESGLTGHDQIVGVADTGLDTGDPATLHEDLRSQFVRAFARGAGRGTDWSDLDGHGTHVVGSVLGNGTKSAGQIQGMAPEAGLVFHSMGTPNRRGLTPGDVYTLYDEARNAGARIHTNSWGNRSAINQYNAQARRTDEYAWDHKDFTILFAAGNEGGWPNTADYLGSWTTRYNTVLSPGQAKNAITVGAAESIRLKDATNLHEHANNPDSMAVFSSRGYGPGDRVKPDVVAPGTWILSTKASGVPSWDDPARNYADPTRVHPYVGIFWDKYNAFYEYMAGTSMATPITAGAAALVRQYYMDVTHILPTPGNPNNYPKASLIKATMINGARKHGQWKSKDSGWGMIDLQQSLYPTDGRVNWFENEARALSSNQSQSYTFSVDAGQILKVTLVWTDFPGDESRNGQLVNNLDLEVTGPGTTGTLYKGNCFDANPSACTADSVNNVENVYLETPAAGTYTVKVKTVNVPNGPQPYSLVVSGKNLAEGNSVICSPSATGLSDATAAAPAAPSPAGPGEKTAGTPSGAVQSEREIGVQSVSAISNRCAAAQIADNGRFNFGLFQPSTGTWYNTSYRWPGTPSTSYTTLRVDGANHIFGSGSGSFVTAPHNQDSNTNAALWRTGDVSVHQTVQIVPNPSTGQPDAAMIKYTMTNAGAAPHEVGLRSMIDTMLKGNDGAPFRVPGANGMEEVVMERDYTGSGVPQFWQAFNTLTANDASVQMTMGGGSGATPPDRMAIAYWGSIYSSAWDYTVNTGRSVTGDSAVGMWWNPQTLAPGETRTVAVYYGRPRVVTAQALTLSCPARIPHRQWGENPFNVVAYFTNSTEQEYPALTLSVDSALQKADGDPDHAMGDVAAGSSVQTTWRLKASRSGRHGIAVRAWQNLHDGRRQLVALTECSVEAEAPPVPSNVTLDNTAGSNAEGVPLVTRCRPLTVNASFPGARRVTLLARDAAGATHSASMTSADGSHWTYPFTPCLVGLRSSPITIRLTPNYPTDPGEDRSVEFRVILIDPSGTIYHAGQGTGWTLPGARITLQYYDPALAAWVNMTEAAYPGLFTPVQNPQFTGSDGRYAWDVAPGDYRVLVSRPGFSDAVSRRVTIPPPVTDLDVGLTPTDAEAPAVTHSGVAEGGSYPGAVTVQLNATDTGGAGIRYLAYQVDGGSEVVVESGNAAVTISAAGAHTVTYRAMDHASNASAAGSVSFSVGCSDAGPALAWLAPLSAESVYSLPSGESLPIRFRVEDCGRFVHDESVVILLTDPDRPAYPVAAWVFGGDIAIDDAAREYRQTFSPAPYGVLPGTALQVQVFLGDRLMGEAGIQVIP